MKPHALAPIPKAKKSTHTLTWLHCVRCGLVALRNAKTEQALRAPCPGKDDDER